MEIRQLKAFIAVFEERSITGAAERLHVSQPTLSVTIRQLEQALDTVLFVRQPRGVAVSEDARALYPRARRIVDESDALNRMFRHDKGQLPLTLGIEADMALSHLQAVLHAVPIAIPGVLLTLQEGCTGDARLAIQEQCCEDELFLPLWEDPFVITEPVRDGPAPASWVICPSHASHQRLAGWYAAHSITVAAHAGSLAQALQLVAAGLGAALLPQSLARNNPGVRISTAASPTLVRRVGLCYAAQALENPAVAALHRHLVAVVHTEGTRSSPPLTQPTPP